MNWPDRCIQTIRRKATVPWPVTQVRPVLVQELRTPATARVGQTIRLECDIDSTAARQAVLRLELSTGEVIRQPVEVAAGRGRLSVPVTVKQAGVHSIRAAIDEAPARSAAVRVQPPNEVLIVRDPKAGDTAGLNWAAILGGSARVTIVSPASLAATSLEAAATLIWEDVPSASVSARVQQQISDRVRNGMGLLLVAGAASVPEVTDEGPLTSLWPLTLPKRAEQVEPSTALVLIMDTSGSMQGESLNLAKEVGRLAMSHLRPTDKVGIVEFFGGRRWAFPIQPVGDGSSANRALARLSPGGASDLFPAVEEAGFALRNIPAQSKHVMVLSDGFVAGGPFAARIRKMAADGITTSAVQIGDSEEGRLLASVALWGQGRFYAVPDRFVLPDPSFKKPKMSMQSPLVRTRTPVRSGRDPLTRNSTVQWPPIPRRCRSSSTG